MNFDYRLTFFILFTVHRDLDNPKTLKSQNIKIISKKPWKKSWKAFVNHTN